MYRSFSKKTVQWLIRKGTIQQEEREVYEYSFEVLYSDLFYVLFALLIAVALHGAVASLLFFAGFFSLRKFAGGYHAATYLRCHLMFVLNQIAAILLFYLMPRGAVFPIVAVMLVLSSACVIALAPVDHENREYSGSERKYFRRMSLIMLAVAWAIFCVLCLFRLISPEYALAYFFGVFSVSISLFFERIKKWKGGKDHDEEICSGNCQDGAEDRR